MIQTLFTFALIISPAIHPSPSQIRCERCAPKYMNDQPANYTRPEAAERSRTRSDILGDIKGFLYGAIAAEFIISVANDIKRTKIEKSFSDLEKM